MTATTEDINFWLKRAWRKGCEYIIVVLYEPKGISYPVYCRDIWDLKDRKFEIEQSYDGQVIEGIWDIRSCQAITFIQP